MILRIAWKRWLSTWRLIPAYCRGCGRDVHDFHVAGEIWARVAGGEGGVLCYDCFAERCVAAGVDPVWRLVPLEMST